MESLVYSFQRGDGSFVLKLRPSRKWRIKANGEYIDDTFDSPEQALAALCQIHSVPRTLEGWAASTRY